MEEVKGVDRSYEIDKFYRNADVLFNLGYSDPEYLKLFKDLVISRLDDTIDYNKLYNLVHYANDNTGNPLFFLKIKQLNYIERYIPYLKGDLNGIDPIHPSLSSDFDISSRRAFLSILSEISLAPRIRSIVESSELQEIVKNAGFSRIEFAEPMCAILLREGGGRTRMLFYKYYKGEGLRSNNGKYRDLIDKLKKHFIKNGVNPVDLRAQQLMVSTNKDDSGNPYLILIDTEAYTIIKN